MVDQFLRTISPGSRLRQKAATFGSMAPVLGFHKSLG